jgi:hypothetical protein
MSKYSTSFSSGSGKKLISVSLDSFKISQTVYSRSTKFFVHHKLIAEKFKHFIKKSLKYISKKYSHKKEKVNKNTTNQS